MVGVEHGGVGLEEGPRAGGEENLVMPIMSKSWSSSKAVREVEARHTHATKQGYRRCHIEGASRESPVR